MSEQPKLWKPNCDKYACVYQPYGSISDPEHAKAGRLYGVCCISLFTTIKGLTKEEAEAVSATLTALRTK
jgi:hypothetical protein